MDVMHDWILEGFMAGPNGLEPVLQPLHFNDPSSDITGDIEQMRLDLAAMTSFLKSLSFAMTIRCVEAVLKENEDEAGPPTPEMSPEDWNPYV